jgi:sugar transferase (PEP-CTERM/EpsH1 system associated)
MKILFLSPRQCWPVRSGAKAREYYLLQALARDAEVDYAFFAEPGMQDPGKNGVPGCRNIVSVPKPKNYTWDQKILGMVGKWPLPILNYTSPRMIDAVRQLLGANHYDLIHLDSVHMIRYAEGAKIPVVYNWHNIESEAMRRYADTVGFGPKSWYALNTAAKMEQLEKRILARDFAHVVCSEREKVELASIEPSARITVVENGVDTKWFADSKTSTGNSPTNLVFVGTMDYYPNIEAVVSFATKVWPSIHNRLPALQLSIVGANPTRTVRDLSKILGVSVTGTVADVRPYYQNAVAAIVPLRTGGGTRLKILEAMAAGVPVISTPLGAEGLDVTVNMNILIADPDDDAAWVRNINHLLETPELGVALAEGGKELVKERYDWDILGRKLSETYRRWLTEAQTSGSAFG